LSPSDLNLLVTVSNSLILRLKSSFSLQTILNSFWSLLIWPAERRRFSWAFLT
jgi:hypothetical protein